MKRIFQFLMLFCMMSMSLLAQEKKAFTLEDVIPGAITWCLRICRD